MKRQWTTISLGVISLALALPAAPTAAWAGAPQEAEAASERQAEQTEIVHLHHIKPQDLRMVLNMIRVRYTEDQRLNAIVIRAPRDRLRLARELIGELDVPAPPRLELNLAVSILEGSRQGRPPADIPEYLAGVVEQLAETFGYKSFRLLDTVLLRVGDGGDGTSEGGIRYGEMEQHGLYRLYLSAKVLGSDESRTIRLANLDFRITDPSEESAPVRARLATDIEIDQGQTVVVGKATAAGGDGALVLVVRAEVLDR